MYGILFLHAIVAMFTAVFIQEAACREVSREEPSQYTLFKKTNQALYLQQQSHVLWQHVALCFQLRYSAEQTVRLFQHHHLLR